MAKLDNITLGNWQVFRKNLTDAVMPYYTRVATAFSDSSKGVGKVVGEQRERVSEMLGLLARMEGKGLTPITRKELKKLEKLSTEFRKVHTQVVVWVKDSVPLRKGSENAIKDLAISPKDAKASIDISKPSLLGRGRGGGLGGLSRMLGLSKLAPALGLGALGGLLSPMLGPLAGPAAVGLGGAYGAYTLAKGLGGISRRKRTGIAGGVVSSAVPARTGGVAPSAAPVMTGAKGQGIVEGMGGTAYPRDARGRFTSRKGTGLDMIEQGLFKFFNKRALRAKWTRRLLRATEKGAKKKGAGGLFGGGLLDSFTKLKILLPALLLGLGKGAGLAGAAVFTAWQLKRAGSAALEWWEVHKNVSESIRKQTKLQIGFLENLTDTLMRKAKEAKTAGDEVARKQAIKGVLEAQKEIHEKREKPGLIETWKTGASGLVEDVKGVPGRADKPGWWQSWKRGAGTVGRDVRKVTGFDKGGVVTQPTLGVIAERQPEVVTPLAAGNVMDVLKAIMKNTASGAGITLPAPIDTFHPPFDLADPLLNRLNTTGSLS